MSGYSFDPVGMRKLYLQGVEAFQARCKEILPLFSVPEDVIEYECNPCRNAADEEKKLFADEAECEAKRKQPRRICESP